jgi:hypothetical protein
MAMHGLAHASKELGTAQGAAAARVPMVGCIADITNIIVLLLCKLDLQQPFALHLLAVLATCKGSSVCNSCNMRCGKYLHVIWHAWDLQVVSTMATMGLQDVAASATHPCLLFQLYVIRDRDLVTQWVMQAEAAGYKALVITVDAQRLGRREADERNRSGSWQLWHNRACLMTHCYLPSCVDRAASKLCLFSHLHGVCGITPCCVAAAAVLISAAAAG